MAAAVVRASEDFELPRGCAGQFDDADAEEVVKEAGGGAKVTAADLFHDSGAWSERYQDPSAFEDNEDDSDGDDSLAELEGDLLGDGGAAGVAGHGSVAAMRSQLESKIDTTLRAAHSVQNDIKRSEKTSERAARHTGRDDRATSEQVLDPRTRLILFKLLNRGVLSRIEGCLSTGKEANVYYAHGAGDGSGGNAELAVKVFKTSILVFRDRDKYVSGEHRYRRGYCRSNPRKMVKVWAEKEMRNLRRLTSAGVPSPEPLLVKSNVLVMQFLGVGGWPSPRIRDAQIGPKRLQAAYAQCVGIMRAMYHRCRLVHGDLSEYNLLYHNNRVFVIDVSQSMEQDHPRAMDFLRADSHNLTSFFQRRGCSVLSPRSLFAFVIDSSVPSGQPTPSAAGAALACENLAGKTETSDSDASGGGTGIAHGSSSAEGDAGVSEGAAESTGKGADAVAAAAGVSAAAECGMHELEYERFQELLREAVAAAESADDDGGNAGGSVDDAVFMSAFIPRSLYEVEDFERKHDLLQSDPQASAAAAAVNQMLSRSVAETPTAPSAVRATGRGAASPSASGAEGKGAAGAVRTSAGAAKAAKQQNGGAVPAAEMEEGAASENGSSGSENSDDEDGISEESGEEDTDSDDASEGRRQRERDAPPTEEELQQAREQRKAAKKAAKEEQREKRKTKIPKHLKKQKIKASKRR